MLRRFVGLPCLASLLVVSALACDRGAGKAAGSCDAEQLGAMRERLEQVRAMDALERQLPLGELVEGAGEPVTAKVVISSDVDDVRAAIAGVPAASLDDVALAIEAGVRWSLVVDALDALAERGAAEATLLVRGPRDPSFVAPASLAGREAEGLTAMADALLAASERCPELRTLLDSAGDDLLSKVPAAVEACGCAVDMAEVTALLALPMAPARPVVGVRVDLLASDATILEAATTPWRDAAPEVLRAAPGVRLGVAPEGELAPCIPHPPLDELAQQRSDALAARLE
jgi:hypothetical protein